MTSLSRAASLIAILLIPRPATADLISIGHGLVYDSTHDLTWLQDAAFVQTSGSDADGLVTLDEATAWVSTLEIGGIRDWRLPTWTPTSGTPSCPPQCTEANEIGQLLEQLGWIWVPDRPGGVFHHPEYQQGSAGPFSNFPAADVYSVYWLVRADTGQHPQWWHRTDGLYLPSFNEDHARPWAVRDGNPLARVPEPATWVFVGLGLVGLFRARTSCQ